MANRVQSDVAKAAMAKSSAQRSARGSTSASSSAAREEIQSGKSVYEQMTDAAALRGNMVRCLRLHVTCKDADSS